MEHPQTPPLAEQPQIIDQEVLQCLRCGYNLHGLHTSSACPECGTPVSRTLAGNLLRYSQQAYLDKLANGVFLIVLSYILTVGLLVLVLVPVILAALAEANVLILVVGITASLIGLAIGIMSLIGWWQFSTPDPDFLGKDNVESTRTILRAVVAGMAVIMVLSLPFDALSWFGDSDAAAYGSQALNVVSGLLGLVLFFVSLIYVRFIAERIPDRELVNQARTYLWLLPLIYIVGMCVLIGPIIATVMYLFMLWRVRKQIVSIQKQAETPAIAIEELRAL